MNQQQKEIQIDFLLNQPKANMISSSNQLMKLLIKTLITQILERDKTQSQNLLNNITLATLNSIILVVHNSTIMKKTNSTESINNKSKKNSFKEKQKDKQTLA